MRANEKWSGRWESNPRLKLGKLGYYHYTTPAQGAFSPMGILVALRAGRQIIAYPMKEGRPVAPFRSYTRTS
jgi:hypothetical protein